MVTRIRIDKKYEGKCVAIVDRKIVLYNKNIHKLTEEALSKYSPEELTITSVPKGNKILVF